MKNNWLKFKTFKKAMEYSSYISREKPTYHNMWPIGLGNTRISTNYAKISWNTVV